MRASGSERFLRCPGSLILPKMREPSPARDDAANFGTLVHHWKETGSLELAGADPSHVRLLREKLELTGLEREDFWSGGEHEITYALDLTEERILRFTGPDGADAWKKSFDECRWLTGTVDWISSSRIDDLKTGRWLPTVIDNQQLKSYALFRWMELGRPAGWEVETSITHWPRYPKSGFPRRYSTQITSLELEEHLIDFQWAIGHTGVTRSDGDGEGHCRFCDSKFACPQWSEE